MSNLNNQQRRIVEAIKARPASDGDGVKLLRVFGGGDLSRFDPYLMLDEFGSYDASDYIGGFPSHPHRGFETVTYMLEGEMEHRDHMNNIGVLGKGDVQWMKAGAGVIHSEMPRQEEGRMRGFQLWVNLPSNEKMTPATYEEISADKIPEYRIGNTRVKAIAGKLQVNQQKVHGPINGRFTEPGYIDIRFGSDPDELNITIPDGHVALVYVYEGKLTVGTSEQGLEAQMLGRLSNEGELNLQAVAHSKVLLMTGKPINEPIVQKGPFVMNTTDEIEKAVSDYQQGRLVS